MTNSVFADFIGQHIKCPYRDGSRFKIAKGVLRAANQGFVKITGGLGTIIIREHNIEKMSFVESE